VQLALQHHAELGSFLIVSLGDTFYAVPKSMWPVLPEDLIRSSNRSILSSATLTDLVDRLSALRVPLLSIIILRVGGRRCCAVRWTV
jgi:hypothetical protein